MDKIIINASDPEECRVAMLDKEGRLQEYYSDAGYRQQSLSNIYKGVIQNIEPSLQAVFVNFGQDRNGFLQLADIHPEYFLEDGGRTPDIKKCLRKGQPILVQVLKEPGRVKGASLTTFISIAGRFVVLTPGKDHVGVSRKIESDKERQRLRSIAEDLPVPEGCGYIVRTVAEEHSKKELAEDLYQVHNLWEDIRRQAQEAPTPSLVYREQDLAIKILRDHYTSEVREILVDDHATWQKIADYIKSIAPGQQKIVRLHKEKRPIFARHQLEEQLSTIFQTTVKLKSGGSIVITPTEALVSIDVNSGKGTREGSLEETAFVTNLEAAEEVARQLRLRDLGGLVVVDFIDMREEKHRRDVERRIREAAKVDKAKTDFGNISKFGLLELTRQRLRPSIELGSFAICPHCQGRGLVKTSESASLAFLRQVAHLLFSRKEVGEIRARIYPAAANFLVNYKRSDLLRLEERHRARIIVTGDNCLSPGQWEIDTYRRTQEGDTLKPGQVAKSGEDGEEETEYRDMRPGPALGHYSSQGGLFNSGSNYNGHQNGGSNGGIQSHQNNGSGHDKSHGPHSGPGSGGHAGHPSSYNGHNGDHRRRQKSRKNREPRSETSIAPNAQIAQAAQAV
ncbi:MAG: Rne/Rng family ribonuclease [Deltaproteobacteria bacterium]|nr:Rne/Rng family ribonuclease [Deltaproteobacteria bacterium]